MSTLISISNSSTLIGSEQPETMRAPEIEPGVGCDFDSYLLVPDNSLDARISSAKARLGKDVVVLGHHYQRDEVVKFADFRGDSLKLSFQAAQTDARYVVFCGVHFMAESADILRRSHQTVVLPDLNAGCSMADMADIGQVEVCWEELSRLGDLKLVPITYMNSTAAIKSFTGEHGGAVCTSSNAAAVMRWAFERGERVRWTHPGIRVIVHPECRYEVAQAADQIGSTEGIIKAISESPAGTEWAVGTEIHLVNRLGKEMPDHKIMSLDSSVCVCTTMFRITPQHLLWALDNLAAGNIVNQISVDERTRHFARIALDRMLSLR